MHATTFSQMVPLPYSEGGYLIDTPGIKGFGMLEMEDAEVSHYFPELFEESTACRFGNCTHTHEPGCAVREAVEAGRIALPATLAISASLRTRRVGSTAPKYK